MYLMPSEYGRTQLHVDLSQCKHWIRMMEVWYKRTETSHGDKCDYQEITIVFMPDLWSGSPCFPCLLEEVPKVELNPEKEEEKEEDSFTEDGTVVQKAKSKN